MVEVVVGYFNGQPVLGGSGGETSGKRPGTEHAALLQAQIEMVSGPAVLVQHERRTRWVVMASVYDRNLFSTCVSDADGVAGGSGVKRYPMPGSVMR